MKLQRYWHKTKLIFLSSLLFCMAGTALGQETENTNPIQSRTVSLRDFGYEDVSVFTPNSVASYFFQLPADWELVAPLILDLQTETFVTGVNPNADGANYQAILEVDYNANAIDSAILDLTGEHQVSLIINADNETALVSRLSDGRQKLDLILNTNFRCDGNVQAGLFVDADSTITFSYRLREISTDLGQLPRPIYQDSLAPDSATLIIPDVPNEAEMTALFALIAGLGRDTSTENFSYTITTSSLVTDEQRQNSHLIYVGKSGRFAELLDLPLVANSQPNEFAIQEDDGILQMLISPWNPSKVLLFVSGETDAGIIKAGEAVSSENVRTSNSTNLAIISDVQLSTQSTTLYAMTNQRFGLAGYELVSLVGAGLREAQFTVYVDPDTYNASDYGFNLQYSHSNLVNYNQSGVEIYINDTRLSTLRLSDETANGGTSIVPIPHSQINAGNNTVRIVSTLERLDPCLDPTGSSVWFNISPETMLTQTDNPDTSNINHYLDLNDYPYPFVLNPRLDDTVFIVPPDNLLAWQEAGRIAYALGARGQGTTMSPTVHFGDTVTAENVANQHILIVGQARDIPFVAQLGTALPATFPADSNYALEEDFQLAYRLTPDKEIGYLQLAESPYSNNHVILTVLGSNDTALEQTVSALLNPSLARFRQGTLQLVDNGRIVPVQMTIQTVTNSVATPTPSAENPDPFNVDPLNPNGEVFEPPRLNWVIDVAFYSSFLIMAIFLFLLISRVYIWIKKYFADRD